MFQKVKIWNKQYSQYSVNSLLFWVYQVSLISWVASSHELKNSSRNSKNLRNHSNPFLAHLAFRPCELLSSLFVRRPSVNISHFNLLLRNHWTNCNQTLVEWSLDGPLSKLCPVIPTSNQDGRQAKNRKKGGWNFNCPLLL